MRILVVLPYVPSRIRVRPYHLIRELARRHEVSVLATGSADDLADAEALRAWCSWVEVVSLTRPTILTNTVRAALAGRPLQAGVCYSPALARRARDLLAETRADLVHVEHLRAAQVGLSLAGLAPTLFDSVDCISLLQARTLRQSHSLRQRIVAAIELRRTRAYEAAIVGRFGRVVVTAPEDRRALQALRPDVAIAVIPNGVDLEHFRPVDGPREPATLVFSGKMSYHANATAALYFAREIYPRIQAARPDVRLRIVGSNPPPVVQALARDPSITVTGYVPDLRAALGTATIALCPVTVKVGIQNKLLEAMALGLPVVATRAGAEGIAAEAGRDLLVADTPAAFADQVVALLGDPARRDRLARAGRRYVETHHRWEVAVSQLEVLYGEAIARRGARSPRAGTLSARYEGRDTGGRP